MPPATSQFRRRSPQFRRSSATSQFRRSSSAAVPPQRRRSSAASRFYNNQIGEAWRRSVAGLPCGQASTPSHLSDRLAPRVPFGLFILPYNLCVPSVRADDAESPSWTLHFTVQPYLLISYLLHLQSIFRKSINFYASELFRFQVSCWPQ